MDWPDDTHPPPYAFFWNMLENPQKNTHKKIRVGAWPTHPLLGVFLGFFDFLILQDPLALKFVLDCSSVKLSAVSNLYRICLWVHIHHNICHFLCRSRRFKWATRGGDGCELLNQCWFNVGPTFLTVAQHYASIGWMIGILDARL